MSGLSFPICKMRPLNCARLWLVFHLEVSRTLVLISLVQPTFPGYSPSPAPAAGVFIGVLHPRL